MRYIIGRIEVQCGQVWLALYKGLFSMYAQWCSMHHESLYNPWALHLAAAMNLIVMLKILMNKHDKMNPKASQLNHHQLLGIANQTRGDVY